LGSYRHLAVRPGPHRCGEALPPGLRVPFADTPGTLRRCPGCRAALGVAMPASAGVADGHGHGHGPAGELLPEVEQPVADQGSNSEGENDGDKAAVILAHGGPPGA